MNTDIAAEKICGNIEEMGLTQAEKMIAVGLPQDMLKMICAECQSRGVIEVDRQWKIVGAALYLALASYQHAEH